MESYEALREAIGPLVRQVAQAVRRSPHLIYKWMEPCEDFTDPGALNPLDRVNTIINTAKAHGRGDLALSPVRWLNMEHGMCAIRLPEASGGGMVNDSLIGAIKEFADLAGATSEAIADHRISLNDRKRVEQEGEEAIRAIITLVQIVKASVT